MNLTLLLIAKLVARRSRFGHIPYHRRLATLALAVITLAAAPQFLKAQEDALCPAGNATLRGTYVLQGEGAGPSAIVGWLTYDGKGFVQGSMTASVNGAIYRFTVSGPYTVNSDCSGSVEPQGGHYYMVVNPDGKTVNWIETDPGTVSSGTEVRLTPRHEDD